MHFLSALNSNHPTNWKNKQTHKQTNTHTPLTRTQTHSHAHTLGSRPYGGLCWNRSFVTHDVPGHGMHYRWDQTACLSEHSPQCWGGGREPYRRRWDRDDNSLLRGCSSNMTDCSLQSLQRCSYGHNGVCQQAATQTCHIHHVLLRTIGVVFNGPYIKYLRQKNLFSFV